MEEQEYERFKKYASDCFKLMNRKYKDIYHTWYKDMEVVAAEMKLNSDQKIYLCKRILSELAARSIEETYHLTDRPKDVVISEVGNTKALEARAELAKIKNNLEETVCKKYYKEFDKRIMRRLSKR